MTQLCPEAVIQVVSDAVTKETRSVETVDSVDGGYAPGNIEFRVDLAFNPDKRSVHSDVVIKDKSTDIEGSDDNVDGGYTPGNTEFRIEDELAVKYSNVVIQDNRSVDIVPSVDTLEGGYAPGNSESREHIAITDKSCHLSNTFCMVSGIAASGQTTSRRNLTKF